MYEGTGANTVDKGVPLSDLEHQRLLLGDFCGGVDVVVVLEIAFFGSSLDQAGRC